MTRTRYALALLGAQALCSAASLFHPGVRVSGYRPLLFSGSKSLRSWAIERLKGMRGRGAEGLGQVVLDTDEKSYVRVELIDFLGELEGEATPAVPALILAFKIKRSRFEGQLQEPWQRSVKKELSVASQ